MNALLCPADGHVLCFYRGGRFGWTGALDHRLMGCMAEADYGTAVCIAPAGHPEGAHCWRRVAELRAIESAFPTPDGAGFFWRGDDEPPPMWNGVLMNRRQARFDGLTWQ